jgi:hypothetical protein
MNKRQSIKSAGNGRLALAWVFVLAAIFAAQIRAQEFTLDTASFAAAAESSGGDFSLKSSIGDPGAGNQSAAGEFNLLPGFWGAVSIVSPSLGLLRDGANIVLLWPESAGAGFLIEQTALLANPSTNTTWTAVDTRIELSGGLYRATVPLTPGNRFFRLHKP